MSCIRDNKTVIQNFRITVSDSKNYDTSAEVAKFHIESEFEKYRIMQDRLFESDFDRVLKQVENKKK